MNRNFKMGPCADKNVETWDLKSVGLPCNTLEKMTPRNVSTSQYDAVVYLPDILSLITSDD